MIFRMFAHSYARLYANCQRLAQSSHNGQAYVRKQNGQAPLGPARRVPFAKWPASNIWSSYFIYMRSQKRD